MAKSRAADLEKLLQPVFTAKHVRAAVKHFHDMTSEFQQEAWEETIGKAGKFVEAALKALYIHVGKTLPANSREFKAGKIMTDLEQLAPGTFDDAIRLTIPRACRFAYDIASNRGARHDQGEVDPNQMDARTVVATAAWILAEMLRNAQKNPLNAGTIKDLVDGITARRYPLIEEVDGRMYFHVPGASARDIAILLLWHAHPGWTTDQELIAGIMRHKFKRKNAEVAVTRLGRLVAYDDSHRLRLLQPGIKIAEELIAAVEID
jgi:hypothetical protein